MRATPRLSVIDKLLTSTGFASIGKTVRDSVVALGTTQESPQDKFTVYEYRHVHREDWKKLRASARRWYAVRRELRNRSRPALPTPRVVHRFFRLKSYVWPSAVADADACSSSLEDFVPAHRPEEPELQLRTYPYMFFPLDPLKMLWDYLIMFLVAYNAVELPYSISFDYVPCNVRFHK